MRIIITMFILFVFQACTMKGPLTTVTVKDGKTTVEKGFLFKKKATSDKDSKSK